MCVQDIVNPDRNRRDPTIFAVDSVLAQYVMATKQHWSFVVWLLVIERGRVLSKTQDVHPYHDQHLVKYLAKRMRCKQKTAQKRYDEAIFNGYIQKLDEKRIYPTARVKLAKFAVARFLAKLEDPLTSKARHFHCPISRRLKTILQFNGTIDKFVGHTKGEITGKLLNLILIDGTQSYRTTDDTVFLCGIDRSTVQRQSSKIGITKIETGLKFDPSELLESGMATSREATEAFKETIKVASDRAYEDGKQLPCGHGKLMRDMVSTKGRGNILVQAPNVYKPKDDEFVQIAPAKRLMVRLKRQYGCEKPLNQLAPTSQSFPSCPDMPFVNPLKVGRDHIPPGYREWIHKVVDAIMDLGQDYLEQRLGARVVKSPYSLKLDVWDSSRLKNKSKMRPTIKQQWFQHRSGYQVSSTQSN